ncbi:MAG: hypothetical protein BWY88_01349 [Synergistetes bacterium ADurb.Bin520]|nr:MAG: hypothetical protein BWY88_01349 [Synergistetes bacterium ADurb.Bin520]
MGGGADPLLCGVARGALDHRGGCLSPFPEGAGTGLVEREAFCGILLLASDGGGADLCRRGSPRSPACHPPGGCGGLRGDLFDLLRAGGARPLWLPRAGGHGPDGPGGRVRSGAHRQRTHGGGPGHGGGGALPSAGLRGGHHRRHRGGAGRSGVARGGVPREGGPGGSGPGSGPGGPSLEVDLFRQTSGRRPPAGPSHERCGANQDRPVGLAAHAVVSPGRVGSSSGRERGRFPGGLRSPGPSPAPGGPLHGAAPLESPQPPSPGAGGGREPYPPPAPDVGGTGGGARAFSHPPRRGRGVGDGLVRLSKRPKASH